MDGEHFPSMDMSFGGGGGGGGETKWTGIALQPYRCFEKVYVCGDTINGEHFPSPLSMLAPKAPMKMGSACYPWSPLGSFFCILEFLLHVCNPLI
jgi:hypothetical protein